MAPPRLYLFDDPVARGWSPFVLTRPAGEILFGTETLRARCERVFGLECAGHLAGDALRGFEEPEAPPCVPLPGPVTDGDALFLSSRFVPDEPSTVPWPEAPAVLVAGGGPVGAWLPGRTHVPPRLGSGDFPDEWPRIPVPGTVLDTVWGLMAANGERIRADGDRFSASRLPGGVIPVGGGRVHVAEEAVIEPGVVVDTTHGPVMLAEGARVNAPCRISGPAWIGARTTVLGGAVASVSIGPNCRIRGEVASSVVLGYSNKSHDGFLGHSIVGRWVNLGAMTSNSDLKNTYGPVRVQTGSRTVETGLTKAGCFLGDHVRTGIGTLLDTGTVVGAASNLFGGRMPPGFVAPFSWGSGDRLAEYDLERFLETAAAVMRRRQVRLTAGVRMLYRCAFEDTAALRTRHLRV